MSAPDAAADADAPLDAGACDDGLFCNGAERHDPEDPAADARGCVAGSAPCAADETCDEAGARCEDCTNDGDGDGDGARSIACGGDDCDDDDALRFPGASEICDAADQDEDCDADTFGVRDGDGDGYTDAACCNGASCGDDCDDTLAGVHPDLPEVCNGADEDCDGRIDEGAGVPLWPDADGDMFGDAAAEPSTGCPGAGTAIEGTDCDDARASANPATSESCNDLDDDCDTRVDEALARAPYYPDCDADGYGAAGAAGTLACAPPPTAPASCASGSWSGDTVDCDDTSASVHPSLAEVCDGLDQDCNGTIDGAVATAWCNDAARALPHATAACAAGECAVASCAAPHLDCGVAPGCEVDGSADVLHCGSCGTACNWSGACQSGTCDDAIAVARGWGYHRCVLRAGGRLACTGMNSGGQLGDGTSGAATGRSRLATVMGPSDFVQAAVGMYSSCAIRAGGALYCWGSLGSGAVTVPTATVTTDAAEIVLFSDGTSVGSGYGLLRRTSGQVAFGRVTGSFTGGGSAMPLPAGDSAVEIGLGVGTTAGGDPRTGAVRCARLASGRVTCVGGAPEDRGCGAAGCTGTIVAGLGTDAELTDAVQLSVGPYSACVRRASGQVACWGSGALGDGGPSTAYRPVAVLGITDAVWISTGGSSACAVHATGTVSCWGSSGSGFGPTPATVAGLTDVIQVVVSNGSTCALRRNHDVLCWGRGSEGQLGDGTMITRPTPASMLAPL